MGAKKYNCRHGRGSCEVNKGELWPRHDKKKPSYQVDVQTVPIDKVLDLWDEPRMYEIKQTSSRLIQVYETLLPLNQILCCPQQAGYQ